MKLHQDANKLSEILTGITGHNISPVTAHWYIVYAKELGYDDWCAFPWDIIDGSLSYEENYRNMQQYRLVLCHKFSEKTIDEMVGKEMARRELEAISSAQEEGAMIANELPVQSDNIDFYLDPIDLSADRADCEDSKKLNPRRTTRLINIIDKLNAANLRIMQEVAKGDMSSERLESLVGIKAQTIRKYHFSTLKDIGIITVDTISGAKLTAFGRATLDRICEDYVVSSAD